MLPHLQQRAAILLEYGVVKFDLKDIPNIALGSPEWQTIVAWSNMNLERLRILRENPDADLRKLDVALGGIVTLKALLTLPATIKKERKRDPIESDDFGIPNPVDNFNIPSP